MITADEGLGVMARTIIISNSPTAARQRLADPSDRPSGRVNVADADHLVVAQARIASVDDGYIELADIEPLQPNDRFYIWAESTIFAYTPTGGTRKVETRPDQDAFRERLLAAYGTGVVKTNFPSSIRANPRSIIRCKSVRSRTPSFGSLEMRHGTRCAASSSSGTSQPVTAHRRP